MNEVNFIIFLLFYLLIILDWLDRNNVSLRPVNENHIKLVSKLITGEQFQNVGKTLGFSPEQIEEFRQYAPYNQQVQVTKMLLGWLRKTGSIKATVGEFVSLLDAASIIDDQEESQFLKIFAQ